MLYRKRPGGKRVALMVVILCVGLLLLLALLARRGTDDGPESGMRVLPWRETDPLGLFETGS